MISKDLPPHLQSLIIIHCDSLIWLGFCHRDPPMRSASSIHRQHPLHSLSCPKGFSSGKTRSHIDFPIYLAVYLHFLVQKYLRFLYLVLCSSIRLRLCGLFGQISICDLIRSRLPLLSVPAPIPPSQDQPITHKLRRLSQDHDIFLAPSCRTPTHPRP